MRRKRGWTMQLALLEANGSSPRHGSTLKTTKKISYNKRQQSIYLNLGSDAYASNEKQAAGKEGEDEFSKVQVGSNGTRVYIEETTKRPQKGAACPLQGPWPGVPRK